MAHACDASTGKVETEGPEVQGYLQLRCEFEASLDYMGPWLKKMEASVYEICIDEESHHNTLSVTIYGS